MELMVRLLVRDFTGPTWRVGTSIIIYSLAGWVLGGWLFGTSLGIRELFASLFAALVLLLIAQGIKGLRGD